MDILRNETRIRHILHKIPVETEDVLNFIITQGMKLDGSSYYSYTELGNLYILFPFKYQVSKEMLMNEDRYTMTGFGGEVSFTLKE